MLDKDTLTRPILEAALEIIGLSPNDRESETYLTKMRPREYESLMAAANENIACGNSAIITAPFIREFRDQAWVDRAQATFGALGADVSYVWVYCDAESMHGYIRQRGAARDGAKLADWKGYLSGIDLNFRPLGTHVIVDNCTSSAPLQSQASALIKSITEEHTAS